MLGYQEGSKGYRLWDKDSGGVRIIVSRDVVFNELVFPCKCTKNETGTKQAAPNDLNLTGGAHFEVELDNNNLNQLPSIQNQMQELEQEPDDHVDPIQGDQIVEENVQEHEQQSDEDVQEVHEQAEDLRDYQLSRDRERRQIRPPTRYSLADVMFSALVAGAEIKTHETSNFGEAMKSMDNTKWKQAMEEEINFFRMNKTWGLVPRPRNLKLVECKWLYKIKDGISAKEPVRYKARLVAQGYT